MDLSTMILPGLVQGFIGGIGSGLSAWLVVRHLTKNLEKLETKIINREVLIHEQKNNISNNDINPNNVYR
jgi:hypothetical protein